MKAKKDAGLMNETALHKKLAAELIALIPEVDEAGLGFLIEQARVHLYNMQVEALNAETEAANAVAESGGKTTGAKKGAKGAVSANAGGKPSSGSPANFRVEKSGSGSTYHLISGGKWKMFNEEEMMSIVKIAQSKDPMSEVTDRLCRWFASERPDTFGDLELGDSHDPKMKELVQFLRKKFSVKKK